MYKFTVRAEELDDCECRDSIPADPAGLYAGIYNSEGYGVASIDRLGRRAGGKVAYHHPQIEGNDEPDLHATTDAEWQSILDALAAAPQMVSVLRNILADLDCGEGLSVAEADVMRGKIVAVLEKAQPSRVVRRTVNVTVEVEVEASDPGDIIEAAIEAVRDGEGTVVAHRFVK